MQTSNTNKFKQSTELNGSEEIQEALVKKAYIHHEHGGHEHGHGSDDNIRKDERKFVIQHEGKKKGIERSRKVKETQMIEK